MYLLLDTCAAIWVAEGEIAAGGAAALDDAHRQGRQVFLSAFSAWELGTLAARGRIALALDPLDWFERFAAKSGVEILGLSPSVLVASSFLPGSPPRDPADRIIIASAREHGFAVMTRDRSILDYAGAGHVKAVPC